MAEQDVVKTEVKLSDDSVKKISAVEIAKIVLANEDVAAEFVSQTILTIRG